MGNKINQRKEIHIVLILLLAVTFSVSNITTFDTYAASKKYTKTYSLKRNYVKTVQLKSKIKSVKSNNKKIATVKKNGKSFIVTTKKKGTAIITVKCKNKKTYKYRVKVSKARHTHKWHTTTSTETIHHNAVYTTELHEVADDGFDFTAAGYSDQQINDYCREHECGFATQPVQVLVQEAWDETVTTEVTTCKKCNASK